MSMLNPETGEIFDGKTPDGLIHPDGSEIRRTTYPGLFEVIDATLGSGPIDDETLLVNYERARDMRKSWDDEAGRMEMEIRRRIEERKGTGLPSNVFVCELKSSLSYDQVSFTPLKEILTEVDLSECMVPEHIDTVVVPDKWNTAKVKALARRYGEEAQRIVDAASLPNVPRLEVKRR